MARSKPSDTSGRGSRELWLEAAYDSLIKSGIDAVRIQPLGKTIDLSRTSFYWFFKDRDALLDALLELWREKNTGNLVRQADAYAESITEAIFNVFDCWLDAALFDSKFEFAIRSWALQSSRVAEETRKADDMRLAALARMFMRFGFDTNAADVRSRTIYLTQIGYISTNSTEDTALRMTRIPHYVEIFTGAVARPQELARFHARHTVGAPANASDEPQGGTDPCWSSDTSATAGDVDPVGNGEKRRTSLEGNGRKVMRARAG